MKRGYLFCGVAVYAWAALFISGTLMLGGCSSEPLPMPRTALCVDYEALMVPAGDMVVPSLTPASAGVRVVVDDDIQPFMGASYPVPGGRMVWFVWIFRWYDGDHLGALGRLDGGDTCRWYDAHISG